MGLPSLTLLTKTEHPVCGQAVQFVTQHWPGASVFRERAGEAPFPEVLLFTRQDILVSFLSPWIVPRATLEHGRLALNFHPGSPRYPGTGCVNFALYDGATTFGATCHIMEPTVDTGAIVGVEYFTVYPTDTVESLLARTHHATLTLFYRIMEKLMAGVPLVPVAEWTRQPTTRAELNALSVITPDMDAAEVQRRVRATTYKQYRPAVTIGGQSFVAHS